MNRINKIRRPQKKRLESRLFSFFGNSSCSSIILLFLLNKHESTQKDHWGTFINLLKLQIQTIFHFNIHRSNKNSDSPFQHYYPNYKPSMLHMLERRPFWTSISTQFLLMIGYSCVSSFRYYDTSSWFLIKRNIYLRNRANNWETKESMQHHGVLENKNVPSTVYKYLLIDKNHM